MVSLNINILGVSMRTGGLVLIVSHETWRSIKGEFRIFVRDYCAFKNYATPQNGRNSFSLAFASSSNSAFLWQKWILNLLELVRRTQVLASLISMSEQDMITYYSAHGSQFLVFLWLWWCKWYGDISSLLDRPVHPLELFLVSTEFRVTAFNRHSYCLRSAIDEYQLFSRPALQHHNGEA
jgi:hypothetical protein